MNSFELKNLITFTRDVFIHTEYDVDKDSNWKKYQRLMDFLNLQHYILVEKEKKTAALLREKHGAE